MNDSTINIGVRTYVGFNPGESGSITIRLSVIEDTSITPENFVYEPYQGQTYDIDLQGNEMVELPNGIKDELVIDKEGNVSLIKNVGKIILDGSEYWGISQNSPNLTNRFSLGLPNLTKNYEYAQTWPIISDCFTTYNFDYIYRGDIVGISGYRPPQDKTSNSSLVFGLANNMTLEEFKQWLSTCNVTVYYPLETPQTIPLGTLSELITTINGTNNISINGNIPTNISATYALDIKKYIDNKLAEISTAMIEEG